MLGDGERDSLGNVLDGPFELGVGEWRERAAVVADEMVVVATSLAHRLEANGGLADVESRDEAERLELVEDPVDAGARHGPSPAPSVAQRILDLDRRKRARLAVEQLEHREAGAAPAVAGVVQCAARAVIPAGAFGGDHRRFGV